MNLSEAKGQKRPSLSHHLLLGRGIIRQPDTVSPVVLRSPISRFPFSNMQSSPLVASCLISKVYSCTQQGQMSLYQFAQSRCPQIEYFFIDSIYSLSFLIGHNSLWHYFCNCFRVYSIVYIIHRYLFRIYSPFPYSIRTFNSILPFLSPGFHAIAIIHFIPIYYVLSTMHCYCFEQLIIFSRDLN